MKLHFFGTCSGTEPMPDTRPTSFAVELPGRLFLFDAGEACSFTAHNMGVDLLQMRQIFISHSHIDHTAGLPNLFYNLYKVGRTNKAPITHRIDFFAPDPDTFLKTVAFMRSVEEGFGFSSVFDPHTVVPGFVSERDGLHVTAYGNEHMARNADGAFRSVSYLIEAEGRRIFFSGDIEPLELLREPLSAGCDILLMETGHHGVERVCRFLTEHDLPVNALFFLHHGREILRDRDAAYRTAVRLFPNPVRILRDGETVSL